LDEVIPVELCLGGVDLSEPRLAPGGSHLGYVRTSDGVAEIVVHAVGEDGSIGTEAVVACAVAPRPGRGLGGGCWCWTDGGAALVHAGVDGNLWWLPLAGASARRLTDHGPERMAQAPVAVPDGSRVVYVVDQAEVWSVRSDGTDAARLDDGSADFCFDPWPLPDSSGAVWLAWSVPDMPWDHARVGRATFAGTLDMAFVPTCSVSQPRVLPDGRLMSVCDDTGWSNVWIDGRPLVDELVEHGGPTWGLGQRSYCWSPDANWIAFTRNEAGFGRLCVVSIDGGQVHEVGRGVHGQLSWEGGRLVALRTGARTPTQIAAYTHDGDPRGPWRRDLVAVGPDAAWSDVELVEPEVVELAGAAGATIHARLYRADVDSGRMICWLHGGPTDQWQVTFMPRVSYWRSRGFHILVPDHRGSTGHGRAYQQALRGRWGELDVADVVAAVRDAQTRLWAVPARTVLIGGSAGGFTVLGALRAAPELAAAAVVSYPVGDLADLGERSHRFERHYTATLVGDPDDPAVATRYRDRSPVWFADRISTPLLVFHGEDDPVVPVAQSRLFVERMSAVHRDDHARQVELCVYPGEGHGFRQRVNQLDEYARIEAFLQRHLP
jgi:dipeptidyl aminopeptidase/acylaminoacyl peptidase